MRIITVFWQPPIPLRQFDWSAIEENYDLGSPIGYGRTEEEAIADLEEQVNEREPYYCAVYANTGMYCAHFDKSQCGHCAAVESERGAKKEEGKDLCQSRSRDAGRHQ